MIKLTRLEIETRLLDLTQQFLYDSGLGKRKVTLDNSLQMHLGLTSLARLELFLEIEKHFDVQFSDQALSEINNLRDLSNRIWEGIPQKGRIPYSKPENLERNLPVEQTQTLYDLLLLYAKEEPNRKHIYFQDERCNEVIITYGELLENALEIAQGLLKKGIRPGNRVAIMLPSSPAFFYTFFGILLVNAIPIPMEPLLREEVYQSFAKQQAQILQIAQPTLLVTYSDIKPFNKLLLSLIPSLKEICIAQALHEKAGEGLVIEPNANDLALILYESESSAKVNEIILTHQNLLFYIRTYGNKLQLTKEDIAVSWAPLYRNPGLVEMWLSCFYYGIPLILMPPYAFLNSPDRWLWTIHYANATISGWDKFAYEYCLKKVTPEQIEGLDLSSWRLALNMADSVPQDLQEKFYKKFAPYGFKKESFLSMPSFLDRPIEPETITQLKFLAPQAYDILAEAKSQKRSFFKHYLGSFFMKVAHYLGNQAKRIYAIYVALVFLLILPPAYLCVWIMSKKAYAKFLHYWARLLFVLIFCPIKIHNKERLYTQQKVIYVANHASYMDTLLFMAILPPETKIIAKQELATAPVISTVIRKLGHILIDRTDFPEGIKKSIQKIEAALEENSILIFPEGTFSYAPGLRPFKLGAFKIACEKNTPIIPIATQGTRRLLTELHFSMRPVVLKIFVGEKVLPEGREYHHVIQFRKNVRTFIVDHCGEPSLHWIAAGKALSDLPPF